MAGEGGTREHSKKPVGKDYGVTIDPVIFKVNGGETREREKVN